MRRMVVSSQRGEFITEMDVEEHELVDTVGAWVRVLPTAGIYLDGQLVPEETRVALQLAMAQAAAMSAPAPTTAPASAAALATASPPIEVAKLKDYGETLQHAFDDLRKGYVQSLRDMQDCAQRFSQMWMERERQFADEAARQRALTHKSLADVDLLNRSIKATQAREQFAANSARHAAHARGEVGIVWQDIWNGFMRIFTGEK